MKIENSNPKVDIKESTFSQIVKNEKLAELLQKIQSTVISNGIELENIIFSKIKIKKFQSTTATKSVKKTSTSPRIPAQKAIKLTLTDLINYIKNTNENIYFKSITISQKDFTLAGLKLSGKENMILDSAFYDFTNKKLYLGEIKSGMSLDTKKSEKEISSLSDLRELFYKMNIDILDISIFITLFICKDLDHSSIKTNRTDFDKYTGEDFCKLIGAPYDEIKKIISEDAIDNEKYIMKTILSLIPTEIIEEEIEKRKKES